MAVLTDDDVIQRNVGKSNATTNHVVTLTGGTGSGSTTAGNTVIVAIFNTSGSFTAPTGFVLDAGNVGQVSFYRKPPDQVTTGETSWTFTTVGSPDSSWAVWEVANMDPIEPMDSSAHNSGVSTANGATLASGTTARSGGLSVWNVACFVASKGTTGEAVSWSGYTNGFTETLDDTGAGGIVGMAAAELFQSGTTSTFSTTATLARSGAAQNCYARVITYRAADAPVASPLYNFTGFEWGTHGGMGTTLSTSADNPVQPPASTAPTGTWGTSYVVQAGSARNGGYGLRITQSGAGGAQPALATPATTRAVSCGVNIRMISATGQVAVFTEGARIMYDGSTNKFGIRNSTTGTIEWESGTSPLNTWRWIEWRFRCDIATFHTDWRIETGTDTYTVQVSPPDLSASVTTVNQALFGSTLTATATYDIDDPVASKYYAAFPIGPHKVVPLKVDAAGTPSVSGTSGNFSVFTSNGTLGAWNATNARNALDEVPPTVSASADGVVQTATAASDYMNFPMETYTLAADETVAGVRVVAALWSGTGAGAGALEIRGHDGTTETALISVSAITPGSPTALAAGAPVWRAAFWPAPSGGWTQAKLNAAALRVGYSSDATPDMGVSAIYLEVAVKKNSAIRQVAVEDPISATVDLYLNPDTSATVSYVITNNDATRSVNFNYSLAGTPQSPVAVGPSSNQTVQINADAFGDVSDLSLEPQ